MASIFTFAGPTRVSSPWLKPHEPVKTHQPQESNRQHEEKRREPQPLLQRLADYGITKLEPEPQEGPVEYKLHLLLPGRDLRKYSVYSTSSKRTQSINATSNMSRQERLEHLSTQLLWRLKQSSQYHATSSRQDTKPPVLPEDIVDSGRVPKPDKLPIGLEDSQGALYEIGVHDGGALIGLPQDEMAESLLVLRNMAASLGCDVKVLREVEVGHCEYEENGASHKAKLVVCEALVMPDLALNKDGSSLGQSTTPQIRVTLAGPTTAGKTTLLGTLSTGTLDNGEGSSRLNHLRHRHEVVSGLTSSVAHELIGYSAGSIFSYGRQNVESWIDIHDGAEGGRLIFISDSAGATRYRRTILRGLVGWAPHWIVLCIAINDTRFSGGRNGGDVAPEPDPDLTANQLDLCLKLGVPLVIAVTKCDIGSQQSFRAVFTRAKEMVERAGRKILLVPIDQGSHTNLTDVPARDDENLARVMDRVQDEGGPLSCVPIIFISAVKGTGIGSMHALLAHLPLPPTPHWDDLTGQVLNPEQPKSLFHIDDKFTIPARMKPVTSMADQPTPEGCVVSGYLRFGSLQVGSRVVVGPFPPQDEDAQDQHIEDRPSPRLGIEGLSVSHSSHDLARMAARNAISASKIPGEWHSGRIATVRNLRLPVQCLAPGQVGTLGIILDSAENVARIRKGMVVAVPTPQMDMVGIGLQAASRLTAVFAHVKAATLTVGSDVHVYDASVRIAARVTQVVQLASEVDGSMTATDEIDDVFSLNDQMNPSEREDGTHAAASVEVSLELFSSRAWIEMGSQILILYRSGLEALVGKVVEIGE
jgi:GTPase